ncbi:ATP-binding protein [Desulforhabdus sp. TSK]|uniref:AAA family ATPase n=1 Tax=Desulforhabdus sp. TSK TaxID=2925014 RepID=UPI001FC85E28|nr:ATP-binding protein [Desulforhabdus sp. TSK]GKT09123.1 hypothetical protein DSTSK_24280 [Desulforhabdus sp. TSK]
MSSSLSEKRIQLEKHLQCLDNPSCTPKQHFNRRKALEEFIEHTLHFLNSSLNGIYKNDDLLEVKHTLDTIRQTGFPAADAYLDLMGRVATARLNAHRELVLLVKKLRSMEFQICQDSNVLEVLWDLGNIHEKYVHSLTGKALFGEYREPGAPEPQSNLPHEVQEELEQFIEQGGLDCTERLTALFKVYFSYLESQEKSQTLEDIGRMVRHVLEDEGRTAEVNTLFIEKTVDPDGIALHRCAALDRVGVRLLDNGSGKITNSVDADVSMNDAVRNGLEAAMDCLRRTLHPNIHFAIFDYTWWIRDASKVYEHESIGLSIALAAIAAYTGVDVDGSIAVTGQVDSFGKTSRVDIEEKCQMEGHFLETIIVPEENRPDIPARLAAKVKTVRRLDEAMSIVLGEATIREMVLSRHKSSLRNLGRSVSDYFSLLPQSAYDRRAFVPRLEAMALVDRFLSDQPSCLILTGEAGMGKTWLLYELCHRYRAAGCHLYIRDPSQLTSFDHFMREFIEITDSTQDLYAVFSHLDQLAALAGKKTILILDAVNEVDQPHEWFRLIHNFVIKIQAFRHVKLIVGCKTHVWNGVQAALHQGRSLSADVYQVISLGEFSHMEFLELGERLTGTPIPLPAVCKYPFLTQILKILYLTPGRPIPPRVSILQLLREYVAFSIERLPDTRVLLDALISESWEGATSTVSNRSMGCSVSYEELASIYDRRIKGHVLSSLDELLEFAKAQSLLTETLTQSGPGVRFRFDWLAEYFLGEHLYRHAGRRGLSSSMLLLFLRNKHRSPYLEGAIKYACLLTNDPQILLEVARKLDHFDPTVISVCVAWHLENPVISVQLLHQMAGIKRRVFTTAKSTNPLTLYFQLIRIMTVQGRRKIARWFGRNRQKPRETESRYSLPLLALKVAFIIGFPCTEIFLACMVDRLKSDGFRRKALDNLGNLYSRSTPEQKSIILEKSFSCARAQTDMPTLSRLIYFMLRCYLESYTNPVIARKMREFLSILLHGFGRHMVIRGGRLAVRVYLARISNRPTEVFDRFFQSEQRDGMIRFVRILDDSICVKADDIRQLERFILEVSRSELPERFVYFFFGTRLLYYVGVGDFALVEDVLARLYQNLSHTTRDLIPAVIALIHRVHPTEESFRLLENMSWKILRNDRAYLLRGGHEENDMYYPLTPVGRASAERQGSQASPIQFFVAAMENAVTEEDWGLMNHLLRELGNVGITHPDSVLLTLQSVKGFLREETKKTLIRSLTLLHMIHPEKVDDFMLHHIERDHPHIQDIQIGVLTYEDDGTMQRLVDSSVLYDFFTLMFVRSAALRGYLIELAKDAQHCSSLDDLIGYGLERLVELCSGSDAGKSAPCDLRGKVQMSLRR